MPVATIGKYQVLGTLGQGGMGIVYKAMDPDIERAVAIKTIRCDTLSKGLEKDDLLARVVREARAAGRLNHPNIVTIYDVFRDGDLTYIVMQYIDGSSLEALLGSGRSYSPREIVGLLKPVAEALDFAHRHGIIHRDIKPANILIDLSGRPFLVDFGVARISASTMTQPGTTAGTLSYMSPEQVKGETVDSRTDVFALGVILYQLLTGKRPFAGDNISTILYRIVHEEPPRLSEINKDLHGGYESVVRRALAKSREERYRTCREMIADLETSVPVDEPTQAYDAGPGDFAAPTKKKTAFFAAAFVALVALLSGGAYLFFARRTPGSSEFARNMEALKTKKLSPVTRSGGHVPAAIPSSAVVAEPEAPVPAAAAVTGAQDVAGPAAALTAELLESGAAAFKRGDHARCVADMKKVLAADSGNTSARRYLLEAETALAGPEIRTLVERHRLAVESKDLVTVLSLYASSGPAAALQSEFRLLFNGYDGIKSIVSDLRISPAGGERATAVFSEMVTAVYKKTGQRKIVFEGRKTWHLRKGASGWKISAVK